MARARNIKPGFFRNADLVELSFEARLLFIGLWTMADREGRLEDRPKQIKMELFPADNLDCEGLLASLAGIGMIARYEASGGKYIHIVSFLKHQMPHHKEVASVIPAPPGGKQVNRHPYDVSAQTRDSIFERDGRKCLKCGSTETLSIDHVVALSLGGDNSTENLQTLCMRCNSSKGGSTKDYRQANVEPTLNQRKANDGASCPSDSLIPESRFLNPESLNKPSLLAQAPTLPVEDRQADARQLCLVEPPPPIPKGPPDCPHGAILALWAEVLPSMPRHLPSQWKGARSDHLRARWRETATEKGWTDEAQGIAYLRKLFSYIGQSPFLTGKAHQHDPAKRPFIAELEWIVNPANWAKCHEGKYHQEYA
jgi:hypothetical protein